MKTNDDSAGVQTAEFTQDAAPVTALTVTQRASLALGAKRREVELKAMVDAAQTIKSITNPDGYKEANTARIGLKNARTGLAALSKEARDDATTFSKACIAEEKRLIGIIQPEETRISTLQEAWDAAEEAEKQRKIAEEAARVQAIKYGIEALRAYPMQAVGKSSNIVREMIVNCENETIDTDRFAEHYALAALAKVESLAALKTIIAGAIATEAEAERNRLAMIELEELRAQKRKDDAAKAESDRKTAEAEANAKRIQDAADIVARQTIERREANEARIAQDALDAQEANELAQLAAGKEEEERIADMDMPEPAAAPEMSPVANVATASDEPFERPSDSQIIAVLADHFDVSTDTAFEWIMQINLFPETPADSLAA